MFLNRTLVVGSRRERVSLLRDLPLLEVALDVTGVRTVVDADGGCRATR